ncbi:MAG TPA: NCS2 family permease, partial [bacterium]|nr:NCS2 family permease [bacterium]
MADRREGEETMEHFFKFAERGTDFRTEIVAGLTTFLTMCYIIFVNPAILSAAGVPFAGAATATAVCAAFSCLLMGLVTNRPIALAAGMGFNAALAFTVIGVQQANVPWQVGMAVVLAEGVVILVLVLTGLRESVMNAIPLNLKRAIGGGIGVFITLIGLNQGGIIRPAPVTLVTIGDFSQPYVWVTIIGLVSMAVLRALKVRADLLLGLLIATVAAVALGIASVPSEVTAPPSFETFFAPFQRAGGSVALLQIFTPALLAATFALMLTDFFDTMGTVVAVGEQAGFVKQDGSVPGIKSILICDSASAALGGLFGGSSNTCYIESAAGVAEGGRTGLTAVVVGLLFAAAAFFAPLIQLVGGGHRIANGDQYGAFSKAGFSVPPDLIPPAGMGDYFVYPITAGALIIVGFLLMKTVREIDW